ncbi:ribose 5-phosphate isomerase A [Foetidibacter luteolus]|uniref:ribose 5-phosphate isomerase A n=1 Tax=Foetidibacter luteolus TaxID=2608880 RepID=UPI00129B7DD9|nr:ribose 5-phosphate isomerase A [Foetidibacter luteolus]
MDLKKAAALKALEFIKDNMSVGLGAGSSIAHLVTAIKEMQADGGLTVNLYTSSYSTKQLLLNNGFTAGDVSSITKLDIYFDGCDQFDKNLHALKSGGGIHTMEKLLASMATRFIIIGDESKYSETLGTTFPLVLEVLPEAVPFVTMQVKKFFEDADVQLRMAAKKDGAVITERGNLLLDVYVKFWHPLAIINPALKSISGIVETSLFYNMADMAILGTAEGVKLMKR